MPDYSLGKVYAIICRKSGRQYVGSTCEPTLARRLAGHVRMFNGFINENQNYCSSFEIIKENDYYIILIEEYSCSSKDSLRMREQYHINLNKCVNKQKAYISEEEKQIFIQEYHQKYYKNNKNKIINYQTQYHKENQEQYKNYQTQYSQENRDKKITTAIQYNQQHSEQLKQKFNCECGGKYTFANKMTHCKTQRHTNYFTTTLTIDARLAT
jgi:hypothetical protein